MTREERCKRCNAGDKQAEKECPTLNLMGICLRTETIQPPRKEE